MTGLSPGRPAPVRSGRAGYIDHKITVVIVLLLAAIAGSRLWPLLPGAWSRFLVLTAGLAVIGIPAVIVIGAAFERREPKLVRQDGRVVARLPDVILPAAGVLLLVFALHFLVHAWLGGGLLWWLVGALGVAAGGLGVALLGSGERLVIEPGRVAVERTLFGRGADVAESRWDPAVRPDVEVSSHTTGGAFGQPLTEVHRLEVAGETVVSGTRERVQALADAVVKALSGMDGRAGASGGDPDAAGTVLERALVRLDAEPPWREGWKSRPAGWDDPEGDGVCAALCRRNGFGGLTIFELETGKVQWVRDPAEARDLDGPLGSELFERLEPLGEEEVRVLGDPGVREVADAYLRSRGFRA